MSEWFQAFWLAVLQGFTEFLPISSSGHLALLPWLAGWEDQGLAFDVAVHVGTLLAVLIYFRKEVALLIIDWCRSLVGGPVTVYSRLAWAIGVATIMVGLAGVTLEDWVSGELRNPIPIAIATIVFGILLGVADKFGRRYRTIESIGWRDVVVIGVAQVLALIPGTSRSGITMTAGLAMGLTRDAAARFSFLLAIPVIALAGGWQSVKFAQSSLPVNWGLLAFSVLVSSVVAFLCIHYFLRLIQRFTMMPFVVYRIVLGVILLAVFM